jgi:hypothetical protein
VSQKRKSESSMICGMGRPLCTATRGGKIQNKMRFI